MNGEMFDPNKVYTPEERRRMYEMAEAKGDQAAIERQDKMAQMLGGHAIDLPAQRNAFTAVAQGLTGYMSGKKQRANDEMFKQGRDLRIQGRGTFMDSMNPGGMQVDQEDIY